MNALSLHDGQVERVPGRDVLRACQNIFRAVDIRQFDGKDIVDIYGIPGIKPDTLLSPFPIDTTSVFQQSLSWKKPSSGAYARGGMCRMKKADKSGQACFTNQSNSQV